MFDTLQKSLGFKMRYVAFDKSAIEIVVQEKKYQSVEYSEGGRLISQLFFNEGGEEELPGLSFQDKESGRLVLSKSSCERCYLVVDLEQFDAFSRLSPSQSLIVLQKVFRACLKNWNSQPFAKTERVAKGDLLVVFPWSISNADGSRAIIDRRPDSKRQEKRDTRNLLLFSFCDKEVEKPDTYTVFKKFSEECSHVDTVTFGDDKKEISPLRVQTVEGGFTPIDSRQSLETWKEKLTETQKKVAFSPSLGPERIEGPAGTGKTLSLVLRGVSLIESAIQEGVSRNIIFITHSNATKDNIATIFEANGITDAKLSGSLVNLQVITLQEWCIYELGNKIEETEVIDKDASDSKEYQRMIIEDVFESAYEDMDAGRKYLSHDFFSFLKNYDESPEYIIHVLHHEIAEVVKGRSQQDIDNYKKIPLSEHALPVVSEGDKEFVFNIYNSYQSSLENAGMFDTDDIVLSALNQLDTPIWRRRVDRDGFDVALVDETHLFNLNELSVLHHLLKSKAKTSIVYTIDRSQSVANSSLSYSDLKALLISGDQIETSLSSVFRSSPEVLSLACEILASGAGIFTALENPLDKAQPTLTFAEESKCVPPRLLSYDSDEEMISGSFEEASKLAEEIGCSKSRVAIIAASDVVLSEIKRIASNENKSHEVIEKRADLHAVRKADKSGGYLIAGIDYVGGLEFEGVVVCGVDKGRLPPADSLETDSRHFLKHASYNRLYVAISRARFGVSLLQNNNRGRSSLISSAVEKGLFEV
ncbi:UvrD-helicase domain-containing protein [Halomonas sp. SL1]|uniref:UvrD-helicase domain-containing protein n=1 Tax=Halomonas sp. SL1 TaxID=2137478 RepID=UPI0015EB5CB2|nr:UvrD-helicase domain-containing protein [Halomonas sp. SL1]